MNAAHVYTPAIAGRGPAGHSPASVSAKRPAARAQVSGVARGWWSSPSSPVVSVWGEEVAR